MKIYKLQEKWARSQLNVIKLFFVGNLDFQIFPKVLKSQDNRLNQIRNKKAFKIMRPISYSSLPPQKSFITLTTGIKFATEENSLQKVNCHSNENRKK